MLFIREIDRDDSEAVAALAAQLGYERSATQINAWIASLHDPSQAPGERMAFVACQKNVAEQQDEVVGWIEVSLVWHLQSDPSGMIGGLVVKEGIRSSGIGKQLCERAEQWVAEKGIAVMRVTSRSTREAAHRFYLRDGYTQIKMSAVFEKKLTPSV